MWHPGGGSLAVVSITLLLLLSACVSQAPPATSGNAQASPSEQSQTPKILRLASTREPSIFHDGLTGVVESAGGLRVLKQIPQNYLVVLDDRLTWVPQVAAEQISAERGTWRVNSDGTMETVWKLHPNVKWHDGTPFTAEDMVFAFTVYKDPDIPNRFKPTLNRMQSATAPDPHTFVVRWNEVYGLADQAQGLEPMPKHVLEEVYRSDKGGFSNSPQFRTEFVGLGAYRLVNWEEGSHLEFARFDDYYLGRPAFDRVIVSIIPDINTVVANLLAGTLDIVMQVGLEVETGVEVQRRWEGTGNQVVFVSAGKFRLYVIQHRPEYARPVNGLTVRTVRQAFYQALDRQTLAELVTAGYGAPADSWFAADHRLRAQVEASIPKYPYDPSRAQQRLAEAGWVRSPDGILVDERNGQRFELEVQAIPSGYQEKLLSFVGDQWKAIGAQMSLAPVPPARMRDNEFRTSFSGVRDEFPGLEEYLTRQLHSSYNASAATRWTGDFDGYSNPRVDALVERFWAAIEPTEWLDVQRELLQEVLTDVAFMPLWWGVEPVLAVKGVKGFRGREAWNFQEWDKE